MRWGVGGGGWGANNFHVTVHSFALAHIRHATLLYVLLHLNKYIMTRYCTSLALAHMRDAMLAHIRHAKPY